jgi:hypothetical protein
LYALYQATADAEWFDSAERFVEELRANFGDTNGGFFATSDAAEELIARPKIMQDNPTPSDNALAMEALQIHAAYTGDQTAIESMEATVRSLAVVARSHPSFAGHALAVWATHLAVIKEVAITGPADATVAMERVIWDEYRPDVVVALNRGDDGRVPLLTGRPATDTAVAYVCQDLVCGLPVTTVAELTAQLDA